MDIWPWQYACDANPDICFTDWRFKLDTEGTWVVERKYRGEGWRSPRDNSWSDPETLKMVVAKNPEAYPNFRVICEPSATPALPYTDADADADVDRLVEMLWVSDHQETGWDQLLGEAYMEGWMEEAVRDARDFLTRYAAFKAKK